MCEYFITKLPIICTKVLYLVLLPQVDMTIYQIMMSATSQIRFGLQIVFVCLYIAPSYYYHCANLSEDIELIKCLRYILSSAWVRLSVFLSYPLFNIWGCVFSVYPFPLWWLREYTLCHIIIIKSKVWIIIHCFGLGHETMVCAVCLSIFLWPYTKWIITVRSHYMA